MKRHAGFTFIELIAVLVILALVAVMAVPSLIDRSDDALTAAKSGSVAAVRSGHAMAIAKQKRLPTLAELADFVGSPSVAVGAAGSGVQVTINETDYIVPTYTDQDCTTATTAPDATVACVGEIP